MRNRRWRNDQRDWQPHSSYDPWYKSARYFHTLLADLGILAATHDLSDEVEDWEVDTTAYVPPLRRTINGRRDYTGEVDHIYPLEVPEFLDEEEIEERDLICVRDIARIYGTRPSWIWENWASRVQVIKVRGERTKKVAEFPPVQGITDARQFSDQWYDRIDVYDWVETYYPQVRRVNE